MLFLWCNTVKQTWRDLIEKETGRRNYKEKRMRQEFKTEFNKLLVDTFNEINKIEELNLKKVGNGNITIAEFHILECVGDGENGRRTIGEIAEVMKVSVPTVTIAVKKLEQKGYLCRHKNEMDGRSTFIALTDEGKRMNRLHSFFHEQMIFYIGKEFDENELELLYRCVRKLNEFFARKGI